jgi:hypothetical protein
VMALPDLSRTAEGWELQFAANHVPPGWKTPQQGAATMVLLAASPLVDGVTGRYFEDNNEAEITEPGARMSGLAAYAIDHGNADRLWDETHRLLGI